MLSYQKVFDLTIGVKYLFLKQMKLFEKVLLPYFSIRKDTIIR